MKLSAALLLFLMLCFIPQGVKADEGLFDTPNQAFTWYSKGPGVFTAFLA